MSDNLPEHIFVYRTSAGEMRTTYTADKERLDTGDTEYIRADVAEARAVTQVRAARITEWREGYDEGFKDGFDDGYKTKE